MHLSGLEFVQSCKCLHIASFGAQVKVCLNLTIVSRHKYLGIASVKAGVILGWSQVSYPDYVTSNDYKLFRLRRDPLILVS